MALEILSNIKFNNNIENITFPENPQYGQLAFNNGIPHYYTKINGNDTWYKSGMSAYELAQINGFTGTESAWLDSLKGANGGDFLYYSTEEQKLNEFYYDGKPVYSKYLISPQIKNLKNDAHDSTILFYIDDIENIVFCVVMFI